MGRDGHRAARQRNDDLGFCFTLEPSLNVREEFDDSLFPSLHTKGDIVQLLVWRVSWAARVMGLEAKGPDSLGPHQLYDAPPYLITDFGKSQGGRHSHTQCPLPIAGALLGKIKVGIRKLKQYGIDFASTRGRERLERVWELRAWAQTRTHSACPAHPASSSLEPAAPCISRNPSGPSFREASHPLSPGKPAAHKSSSWCLPKSEQPPETAKERSSGHQTVYEKWTPGAMRRPPTSLTFLEILATAATSPDPVCCLGPDNPAQKIMCGPKICGIYLHGGAGE